MFLPRFLGADRLARYEATLERLHAPVATARRIAFLEGGSAPAAPILTAVSTALARVPGRRVVTDEPESTAARNADVVLAHLGEFTTLADTVALASRFHTICIVTSTDRAEADPALALAETLATSHGLGAVVACDAATPEKVPGAAARWTKIAARRTPERLVLLPASATRRDLATATLAAALLQTAIDAPLSTPQHALSSAGVTA